MTRGESQSGLWGDRLFSSPLCQVMLWEFFKWREIRQRDGTLFMLWEQVHLWACQGAICFSLTAFLAGGFLVLLSSAGEITVTDNPSRTEPSLT